jgi:hypothetical protein
MQGLEHSFKTRSGGSTRNSIDLELEPDRVEEKTGEEKTRCDLANSIDWPGDCQKPSCNPLTFVFVFLLKTMSFWFFLKKLTQTTRTKPEFWTMLAAGSSLKTIDTSVFVNNRRYKKSSELYKNGLFPLPFPCLIFPLTDTSNCPWKIFHP